MTSPVTSQKSILSARSNYVQLRLQDWTPNRAYTSIRVASPEVWGSPDNEKRILEDKCRNEGNKFETSVSKETTMMQCSKQKTYKRSSSHPLSSIVIDKTNTRQGASPDARGRRINRFLRI